MTWKRPSDAIATFASQMYRHLWLVNQGTERSRNRKCSIGELPLMTDAGTFIIKAPSG